MSKRSQEQRRDLSVETRWVEIKEAKRRTWAEEAFKKTLVRMFSAHMEIRTIVCLWCLHAAQGRRSEIVLLKYLFMRTVCTCQLPAAAQVYHCHQGLNKK
ncbi:hypothetical protein NDU88_009228 [Pleurodeles waltl]|uniref:Uncharacterized protein n=1 Tax=Pleurodeles waltl TaxID=8319 RepID=A0AAV7QUM0_PLEWA|nr:hypothetical protein NDU88_009228 [Pleurodeles waltl]